MNVFVVDPHSIYRRGLALSLRNSPDVTSVEEAGNAEDARANPALTAADVVVIDPDGMFGALELITELADVSGGRVIVCTTRQGEDDVLASIEAGAMGYLAKETLGPDTLVAAVRAVGSGAGVMAPELLGELFRGVNRASRDLLRPAGMALSPLNTREVKVLQLVADGHAIREVASELSYSERTIKNVIHDVVSKLNVRTRAQAVAQAVRDGWI
jgi:DNA-binding NarL/FixJ family response regulator